MSNEVLLSEAKAKPGVDIVPKEVEEDYRPKIGIPATLIGQLFIALSRTGVKYLYDGHPEISSIQFLFYRTVVAFAFNIVWLNKNLGKELCGSVRRDLACQLVVKVIHGNFQAYFLYTAVMYWPLTTTAAARLIVPFFVLILACIFLREYATRSQLIYLLFTLGGASMIVFSTEVREEDAARIASLGSASFLAYVYLFGEPFGAAVGQVMMRKLRKLSNMTVSSYTNLSGIPVFGAWILLSQQDIFAYMAFNWIDWVVLIAVSVLLVFAQTLYFVSLQNLPAPALQPMAFVGMVYQFFIDLAFFHNGTNLVQIAGICLVTAISSFQVSQIFCCKPKVDEDKPSSIDEETTLEEPLPGKDFQRV